MANNIGTLVTSPIRPQGQLDSFPTALSNELLGGHHQVEHLSERNGVPVERRQEGMTCYVAEAQVTYQLIGGLTNDCWQLYGGGSGGSGTQAYFYIDEEVPVQDSGDPRLFTLVNTPIAGSLKVFHEGLRLKEGLQNDYLFLAPASFRISDERDFEPTDQVLADYRMRA